MVVKKAPFTHRKTVGIVGGGQLGRMCALAAYRMGYTPVIFCQDPQEPAAQVADYVVGDWRDRTALERFAKGLDAAACEWENAPVETISIISKFAPVLTLPRVLEIGRSRRQEKSLANALNIPTTHWVSFDTLGSKGELFTGLDWQEWADDLIVKVDNGGYDGKGQWQFLGFEPMFEYPWHDESANEFIVEERVDLAYECSVFVERYEDGAINFSPAVRNNHTNRYGGGILEYSYWEPGCVPRTIEIKAQNYACMIAGALDLIGIITCEFFVTTEGRVLFNELAPRVHNSFHGTIEATPFSQFDRQIATVCGDKLPLMKFSAPWLMINLIGDHLDSATDLTKAGWAVHDYGKAESRQGRKMGHATYVGQPREVSVIEGYLQELYKLGLLDEVNLDQYNVCKI